MVINTARGFCAEMQSGKVSYGDMVMNVVRGQYREDGLLSGGPTRRRSDYCPEVWLPGDS